jgi:hypothetical protein
MKVFDRERWIEEDCVYVDGFICDACPYIVYDEFGYKKCDKKMYEHCGETIEDEES